MRQKVWVGRYVWCNPVQCSATDREPHRLKAEFGKDLVFWGGGVDTQKTMAFGTPEEVYREVRERIDIFNARGGFVFDAIHNIQCNTPIANLEAMFRAIRDSCGTADKAVLAGRTMAGV